MGTGSWAMKAASEVAAKNLKVQKRVFLNEHTKLSVHSEFQPLEEMIVGKAHSPDAFNYLDCADKPSDTDREFMYQMQTILRETEDDLQTLVRMLRDNDVIVKRPKCDMLLGSRGRPLAYDFHKFRYTFPNHPLMPRDTVFVHGNTALDCFTKSENRFLENWGYYKIFCNYFENGANWISMPMPELSKRDYVEYDDDTLLFHAANLLKCGKHILYTQPKIKDLSRGKGTSLGIEWIKRQFPNNEFIEIPAGGHADGKLSLIKPGLIVTWDEKFVPKELKHWDIITVEPNNPFPEHFKKIKKRRFYKDFVQQYLTEWIGYVDETVFDVNLISINESLIFTNGYNKDVYQKLKQHGVEAVPYNFRHQYFWDGALHCITLDTRRTGGEEIYV